EPRFRPTSRPRFSRPRTGWPRTRTPTAGCPTECRTRPRTTWRPSSPTTTRAWPARPTAEQPYAGTASRLSELQQPGLHLGQCLHLGRAADGAVGQNDDAGTGHRVEVHGSGHAIVGAIVTGEVPPADRRELPAQALLRGRLLPAHLLDCGTLEDLGSAQLPVLAEGHQETGQLARARTELAVGIVGVRVIAVRGVVAARVGVIGHGDVGAVEVAQEERALAHTERREDVLLAVLLQVQARDPLDQ